MPIVSPRLYIVAMVGAHSISVITALQHGGHIPQPGSHTTVPSPTQPPTLSPYNPHPLSANPGGGAIHLWAASVLCPCVGRRCHLLVARLCSVPVCGAGVPPTRGPPLFCARVWGGDITHLWAASVLCPGVGCCVHGIVNKLLSLVHACLLLLIQAGIAGVLP